MAFTVAAYAIPGAVSTPRLVDPQTQGAASSSRLSYGANAVKFHDAKPVFSLMCVSASTGKEPSRRGRQPKSTASSIITNAVKKKTEEKQVLDGAALEETKPNAQAVSNGKPKVAVHLFEYEEGPWPCSVSILPHLHDVAESLADHVARISAESIKAGGSFTIVLSGGSLVKDGVN
jgi:hypothetical protein